MEQGHARLSPCHALAAMPEVALPAALPALTA